MWDTDTGDKEVRDAIALALPIPNVEKQLLALLAQASREKVLPKTSPQPDWDALAKSQIVPQHRESG